MQEVDISNKVGKYIKFGVPALVVIAIVCSTIVWILINHGKTLTVNDAQVSSSMISVRTGAPGQIAEYMVEDGARVEAGDVIARVKGSITEEQLKQLEQTVVLSKQNLEQVQRGRTVTSQVSSGASYSGGDSGAAAAAKRRLDRMNTLYSMGAVSAKERDAAEADYQAALASASSYSSEPSYSTTVVPSNPQVIKNAELQVKQAEAALENAKKAATSTEITAPVAGTVYLSDTEAGAEVKAGQTVAYIGIDSSRWVEAYVKIEDKAKIALGQLAEYAVNGKKFNGTVTEITDPSEENAENEEDSSENKNTEAVEGETPSIKHKGKLVVKISVTEDSEAELRPGAKAIVEFKKIQK